MNYEWKSVRSITILTATTMSLTRSFTTMPSEKFKIILLGDPAVGKTSLLTRFIFDTYDTQYQSTLGIDFYSKLVSLHDASDTVVRLHLWDTAGQERFHALITNYIRHSAAALIVYDIGSRMSFAHVQHHIDGVRAERGDHVVIVLVGNKSDLPASEREVSCAEAAAKAEACGAYWAEVSAQTGDRVKWLFRHVAQCVWAASAQKRSGQGVPNMAQCGLSHTSHPVERTSFQQDSNEGETSML